MIKKRSIVVIIVSAFVLLGVLYLWGPSKVPPGQQPLLKLSSANLSDFQKAFDADADAARLVLLVSPT